MSGSHVYTSRRQLSDSDSITRHEDKVGITTLLFSLFLMCLVTAAVRLRFVISDISAVDTLLTIPFWATVQARPLLQPQTAMKERPERASWVPAKSALRIALTYLQQKSGF